MERFWSPAIPKVTVGLDLGDRKTELCQLDEQGQVAEQSCVRTTRAGIERRFRDLEPARVVLEAGTHSPWISRMLEGFGHEVIVANPAELYAGKRKSRRKKNDRIDAEFLARQGRADPGLLFPIQHRSEETQGDLALIHSRDALVRTRASLVNHVRGTVKSVGGRLPASSTPSFARTAAEQIPEALRPALVPVLEMIQTLSEQIVAFERQWALDGVPSCPSAKRGMRSCVDFWSAVRTTFWVPSVRTRISDAETRTRRTGWEEREEARGNRRRAQVGRPAAPPVEYRRGV